MHTVSHPTLQPNSPVAENSFGLDHTAIAELARLSARHPHAVGFVIEIHSAQDPVHAPCVTARAVARSGALGDRDIISC